MCLLLAAGSCKQVLLFFPQGLSCDYVTQVPGLIPSTTSKLPPAYHDETDPEDGDDAEEGQCPDGGASTSASAAVGQPLAAAAAAAPCGPVKDPQEQHVRMVLRQQRRWGDAAMRARARADTIRLQLRNKKLDKVDYAAVFIARVGENNPEGIVHEEMNGVLQR
jgi:hypothetical protein